jgi:hypothetical protein
MHFGRPALTILIGLAGLSVTGAALADVAVTRQDCDRMVEYQQPSGVEYQAGVDAHGQPVVPADLNGGITIKAPETVVIPIELFLQDKYHIPGNSVLWSGKAEVGTVTVHGKRVYFNGQELSDPEQAALADLCQQRLQDH